MKKISLLVEKRYPFFCTLAICVILYCLRDTLIVKSLYKFLFDATFLTAILTALSIVFGFLLTSFATIYNSESNPVKAIKEANRFDEVVKYNRQAVRWIFCSVILTSLFLLSYKLDASVLYYDYFVAIWTYSTIYSVFLSFRFLDIFYVLI